MPRTKSSSPRTPAAPAQSNEAPAASSPKLAAVPDRRAERIRFHVGRANSSLADLLVLGDLLPTAMYDPKRNRGVLDIDIDAKNDAIESLLDTADCVIRLIQVIGVLMSGQGKGDTNVDNDVVVSLGYQLHDLGLMAEQLVQAVVQIEDLPASEEASHA